MIKVDPGAQQTDAFQECRNLLLSKKAHADAIPGLEILANDVRCTHAAAIAQIDPEQVFYLNSRGLDDARVQAPRDRGLHGRAGRALRGGPDPRGDGRRARAPAAASCSTDHRLIVAFTVRVVVEAPVAVALTLTDTLALRPLSFL